MDLNLFAIPEKGDWKLGINGWEAELGHGTIIRLDVSEDWEGPERRRVRVEAVVSFRGLDIGHSGEVVLDGSKKWGPKRTLRVMHNHHDDPIRSAIIAAEEYVEDVVQTFEDML